ncbi:contractile injection system protein, VgrG/Pvc8 family [Parabacteroides sp.]
MKYTINISKSDGTFSIQADIANGVSSSFRLVKGKLLDNYDILVEDFIVEKQIFASNVIRLKLLVNTKSGIGIIGARKELNAALIGSKLSLSQTFSNSDNNEEVLNIAMEYPVIDLKYSSGMSQIYIDLFAFSPDRYAALNKHSEAFTGKTIDEILKTAVKEPFGCEYDIENTLHLHYMMKKDAEAEKEERQYHRIPYAVQYNESTYNFISRLAKRHGEFLFFEDKHLHIGCKQEYEKPKEESIKIKSEDITNISFEDSTPSRRSLYVGNNHLAGEESAEQYKVFCPEKQPATSAKEYDGCNVVSAEYANNDSYIDIKELKADKTNKADEDAFLQNPDNFDIEDGTLLKLYDLEPLLTSTAISTISDVLNSGSFAEMGVAVAMNIKSATYDNFQEAVAINSSYKSNIKKGDKMMEVSRYNDGPYGQSLLKYPDHFAFVSYITERSKNAFDNRISLLLDIKYSNKNLKLGSLVTLEEKEGTKEQNYFYIVTSIQFKRMEEEGKEPISKKLPRIYLELIPYIPLKEGGTIPYFATDDLKRESSSQIAIVVDTKDPYRLNRVRVSYPWQLVDKMAAKDTDNKIIGVKNFKDLSDEDLRANASPWIRVATPASKGGGGFVFTPEKYSEVMVNYENGNIDRPYVESCVFRKGDELFDLSANNEHTSSISSHHGQKIVFHDGNDGASFFTNLIGPIADIGMNFISADGYDGGDKIAPFDGYTEITDNYSINSIKLSATDREISLKSSLGNISINALTGISIEAPNGDIEIKGKNVSISAGNNLSLVSGTNIKRPSQVSSTKVSLISAINDKIGINFSLLRTIIEAVFKPVGGAMVIKSNRSLSLEAGRGNAQVSTYVKRNPLKPKDVSELQVLPIKEPLLHFIRIFDNCRMAIDLIKEKKEAYRIVFESPVTGCAKIQEELKAHLVESKHADIERECAKLMKPDEVNIVVLNDQLQRVEVDFDIKSEELKKPELVGEVDSLKEKALRLRDELNAYMETKFYNKDKLSQEINQIDQPLQELITKRLFGGTIPDLETVCGDNSTEYPLIKQVILGELAAKRILLLCIIQLMQEDEARTKFNVESTVIVLDLPELIQKIVNRFVKEAPIRTAAGNALPKEKVHIVYKVKLKTGTALTENEMSEINASWRFIVNNIFNDEELGWGALIWEAIGIDGLRDDMPYFVKKKALDRRTLDDGQILFSDDRHITYRYDSHMKEFVVSDSSYDNEILGKLKEVMSSLEEDLYN